jgi:hypothetical protein
VINHLICAHLGENSTPEVVAEMADLLLRHQQISWVLCTGKFESILFLSIWASTTKARAGRLIKNLVPNPNNAGGHNMLAGGRIELHPSGKEHVLAVMEAKLSQQVAELLGYTKVRWKSLLEAS